MARRSFFDDDDGPIPKNNSWEDKTSTFNSSTKNRFVFEVDEDGNFTIKRDGKVVSVTNIRGPQGHSGKQGETGPRGDQGIQGPQGVKGVDGNTWTPVISEDGTRLHFRISDGAVTEEFEIRGERGEKGDTGPKGSPGEPGHQGEPGVNGTDGETWRPVVSSDGDTMYFENGKGEKSPIFQVRGRQGEQGLPGQQGERGPQGPAGPKGVDGITWQPIITPDGQRMYFENGLGERTSEYEIRGPRGDQGIPGIQGVQGKDGRTFTPRISEGYLWYVDDEGVQVTPKVKIVGETGKEGKEGKSAYEVWLKNPDNFGKTEEEYLESLRGQDGHNVPSQYNLTDLKDYTCPIETINPHMIGATDRNATAKNAAQTIQAEKARIKDLRRQGEEYHNHGSWIQEFFWWCSGADRPLLRMCPGDHSKYMGIGTVIFFTALMAWFSSFVALGLVTGEYGTPKDIIEILAPVAIFVLFAVIAFCGYKYYRIRRKLSHLQSVNSVMRENGHKQETQSRNDESTKEQREAIRRKIEIKNTQSDLNRFGWKAGILLGVIIAMIVGLWIGIDHGWFSSSGFEISWAAFLACAWSLMIFFLDRFITNTMYSDGKVTISWLELRSALPRIVIAIFLGIVISAPLELNIFKQEIDDKLSQRYTKEVDDKVDKAIRENDNLKLLLQDWAQADGACKRDSLGVNQVKSREGDTAYYFVTEKVQTGTITTTTPTGRRDELGKAIKSESTHTGFGHIKKQDTKLFEEALQNALEDYDKSCKRRKDISQQIKDTIESLRFALAQDSAYSVTSLVRNAGLYDRLSVLHDLAYKGLSDQLGDKGRGYKEWPDWYGWIAGGFVLVVLIMVCWPFFGNVVTQEPELDEHGFKKSISAKEKTSNKKKGAMVVIPWIVVVSVICGLCCDTLFHALPCYIFSAVGMIMMLFIIIDVSPVFYKMMLADGVYDKILHKEKLLTEDEMRLNAAETYAKVTDSEIGRLAPFVFGRTSEKILAILNQSLKSDRGRVDDLALKENIEHREVSEANTKVFEHVLKLKTDLIRAAYTAWYRDMRDAMLGLSPQNDPNPGHPEDILSGKEPVTESQDRDGGNQKDTPEKSSGDPEREGDTDPHEANSREIDEKVPENITDHEVGSTVSESNLDDPKTAEAEELGVNFTKSRDPESSDSKSESKVTSDSGGESVRTDSDEREIHDDNFFEDINQS